MTDQTPTPDIESPDKLPWHHGLTRYHWFVFLICTLGWTFDCLDAQLFALARTPAIAELKMLPETDPMVAKFAGYATSWMLIGWATGGIIFGIMGDRIGRAKTMVWTILFYSIFTGMCGLAQNVPQFLFFRFMTGLGVGGQFAVCVTMLAETMPARARSRSLGMLQAFATLGNATAPIIAIAIGQMTTRGILPFAPWRWMFAIGTIPALLAFVVMRYLDEPEAWKNAAADNKKGKKKTGSVGELFGDRELRKRIILGMLLATAGVIGLWGIGFFSIDLNRTVVRRNAESAAIEKGDLPDIAFVALATENDQTLRKASETIKPQMLLAAEDKTGQLRALYKSKIAELPPETTDDEPAPPAEPKPETEPIKISPELIDQVKAAKSTADLQELIDTIKKRQDGINGEVRWWGGMTSLLFNIGAFFGIYMFAIVTDRIGRRWTFTIAFLAALGSTLTAFLFMNEPTDILWMVPLMGFCQLSIFGGYAIYFPELFPTRLRSTATSFCYNIGRYLAAPGAAVLGILTSEVFVGYDEPMRLAGAAMCSIFLLGIVVIWFSPETKGQPLPE